VLRFLWRASRGYRLRPWNSPYLRWRIETYSGLHAEHITFADAKHEIMMELDPVRAQFWEAFDRLADRFTG